MHSNVDFSICQTPFDCHEHKPAQQSLGEKHKGWHAVGFLGKGLGGMTAAEGVTLELRGVGKANGRQQGAGLVPRVMPRWGDGATVSHFVACLVLGLGPCTC